jgi:type IV fimbrial biogenesis protein FimT
MRRGGFTLIELMVCVAIVAILTAIAMPNFAVVVENSQVRSTADQLRDTVMRARQEALKRNAPVRVSSAGNVITLAVPVFGANPAVQIMQFISQANVADAAVTLNGSGRANDDVTFSITSPGYACKANAGPIDCYNVQVFAGGAVRMCDPTKPEGDLKACL